MSSSADFVLPEHLLDSMQLALLKGIKESHPDCDLEMIMIGLMNSEQKEQYKLEKERLEKEQKEKEQLEKFIGSPEAFIVATFNMSLVAINDNNMSLVDANKIILGIASDVIMATENVAKKDVEKQPSYGQFIKMLMTSMTSTMGVFVSKKMEHDLPKAFDILLKHFGANPLHQKAILDHLLSIDVDAEIAQMIQFQPGHAQITPTPEEFQRADEEFPPLPEVPSPLPEVRPPLPKVRHQKSLSTKSAPFTPKQPVPAPAALPAPKAAEVVSAAQRVGASSPTQPAKDSNGFITVGSNGRPKKPRGEERKIEKVLDAEFWRRNAQHFRESGTSFNFDPNQANDLTEFIAQGPDYIDRDDRKVSGCASMFYSGACHFGDKCNYINKYYCEDCTGNCLPDGWGSEEKNGYITFYPPKQRNSQRFVVVRKGFKADQQIPKKDLLWLASKDNGKTWFVVESTLDIKTVPQSRNSSPQRTF